MRFRPLPVYAGLARHQGLAGVAMLVEQRARGFDVVLVGTSGWQYDSWLGRFYPEGLAKSEWLAYLSHSFPTVEVDSSFYRLPSEASFERWRAESAPGFVLAVKASRFITHVRRLADCAEAVALLWSRAAHLGDKLGPMLFQLPPTMKADPARLGEFIRVLPGDMRPAFEFRNPTWLTDEVLDLLDGAGAALVLADRPGARVEPVVTGGWSYVRLHQGTATAPGYPRWKLRRWAQRIAGLPAAEVYAYFNNDTGAAAVRDAATLTELLEPRAPGRDPPRARGDHPGP